MPRACQYAGLSPREAVVAAARVRFLRHGYAHSTLEDIARDTGIPTERIEPEFINTRELLIEVRDAWLREAGFDTLVGEVMNEPDAGRRIELLAGLVRRQHEVGSEVAGTVDEAAQTEPAVEQIWTVLRLAINDLMTPAIEGQLAPWVSPDMAVDAGHVRAS